jgi:hypothetical protein
MAVPDTRDGLASVGFIYTGTYLCRGCGCDLLMFRTPRGKTMPMSPIPGTEDEDPQRLECHIGRCPGDKKRAH